MVLHVSEKSVALAGGIVDPNFKISPRAEKILRLRPFKSYNTDF